MTSHLCVTGQCEASSGRPSTQAASPATKKVLQSLPGPCKPPHFQLYSLQRAVIASKKAITILCLANTKKVLLLRPGEASTVAGKQASRLRLKLSLRRATRRLWWVAGKQASRLRLKPVARCRTGSLLRCCGEASVASAIETRERRCRSQGR